MDHRPCICVCKPHSFLDETCPSLILQEECRRAASQWQLTCAGIGTFAFAAFILIVSETRAQAERTASDPEPSHPLGLLAYSHCSLVVSWLLCTPLMYPLKLFSLFGTPDGWTAMSIVFAVGAITAYISGTTLWMLELVRTFCAWRRMWRNRTPAGAESPGGSERDVALQDV